MSLRVGITKRFSEAPWPCQTPCRGWSVCPVLEPAAATCFTPMGKRRCFLVVLQAAIVTVAAVVRQADQHGSLHANEDTIMGDSQNSVDAIFDPYDYEADSVTVKLHMNRRGASADAAFDVLERYRSFVRSNSAGSPAVPTRDGYELCSMCQAMYTRGSCSSSDKATASVREKLGSDLDSLAQSCAKMKRPENLAKVAEKAMASLAAEGHAQTFDQVYKAASERIDRQLSNVTGAQYAIRSELTCPDDSQLWWDTCSKVLGATS